MHLYDIGYINAKLINVLKSFKWGGRSVNDNHLSWWLSIWINLWVCCELTAFGRKNRFESLFWAEKSALHDECMTHKLWVMNIRHSKLSLSSAASRLMSIEKRFDEIFCSRWKNMIINYLFSCCLLLSQVSFLFQVVSDTKSLELSKLLARCLILRGRWAILHRFYRY